MGRGASSSPHSGALFWQAPQDDGDDGYFWAVWDFGADPSVYGAVGAAYWL